MWMGVGARQAASVGPPEASSDTGSAAGHLRLGWSVGAALRVVGHECRGMDVAAGRGRGRGSGFVNECWRCPWSGRGSAHSQIVREVTSCSSLTRARVGDS
jgi:hypothetical protein